MDKFTLQDSANGRIKVLGLKKPMKNYLPVSSLLHHKGSTVWSVLPDTTVFDAIKLMADKNIGALPVISKGVIVGVFTERDYTRKIALQGKSSKDTFVWEIISQSDRSASRRTNPSKSACG